MAWSRDVLSNGDESRLLTVLRPALELGGLRSRGHVASSAEEDLVVAWSRHITLFHSGLSLSLGLIHLLVVLMRDAETVYARLSHTRRQLVVEI